MTPTDALVIGAGPVGLFQVFQLGLQEIGAEVVDALPHAGGQCAELYGDKPIYDIPGIPVCTGLELTQRLLEQIAPMRAPMHLGHEVSVLEPLPEGGFRVETRQGLRWLARTVFIAAGAGAFVPRPLSLPGIEAFAGSQLFYRDAPDAAIGGAHALVFGGEDEALQTALDLLSDARCASVALVHRRDALKAEPTLEAAARQAIADGRLTLVVGQPVGFDAPVDATGQARLRALKMADADARLFDLPADLLLPRLGLSPRLGPVAQWGLAMARKQLVVDTESYATNVPGIYAVGDINTYPGKKKLILCGFHEATLAAFDAANRIHPERRTLLQYTTTSTRLHEILGVAGTSRPIL